MLKLEINDSLLWGVFIDLEFSYFKMATSLTDIATVTFANYKSYLHTSRVYNCLESAIWTGEF